MAHADPHRRGAVISWHHCRLYEPGQPAFDIACSVCGEQAKNGNLTEPVRRWLAAAEWAVTPDLLCSGHAYAAD
jgi:hypothetical protein